MHVKEIGVFAAVIVGGLAIGWAVPAQQGSVASAAAPEADAPAGTASSGVFGEALPPPSSRRSGPQVVATDGQTDPEAWQLPPDTTPPAVAVVERSTGLNGEVVGPAAPSPSFAASASAEQTSGQWGVQAGIAVTPPPATSPAAAASTNQM